MTARWPPQQIPPLNFLGQALLTKYKQVLIDSVQDLSFLGVWINQDLCYLAGWSLDKASTFHFFKKTFTAVLCTNLNLPDWNFWWTKKNISGLTVRWANTSLPCPHSRAGFYIASVSSFFFLSTLLFLLQLGHSTRAGALAWDPLLIYFVGQRSTWGHLGSGVKSLFLPKML